MLQVLTEFQLCKHGRHLSKWDNRKCFVDVWRSCLFCQKVIQEKNYRCVFGHSVVHFHSQILDNYIKLTRWQANAMGPAMFVSYPTAPLCKTQHDWMTASQQPLRFQKCGSAFQNVMNISTLSNALVNIREELWLADSDIPRLRKTCSGQAGLPGSLPPRVLRPWLERMHPLKPEESFVHNNSIQNDRFPRKNLLQDPPPVPPPVSTPPPVPPCALFAAWWYRQEQTPSPWKGTEKG